MSMVRPVLHALLLFWLAQSIRALEPYSHYAPDPEPMPVPIDLQMHAMPEIDVNTGFRASDVVEPLKMTTSKGSLNSHRHRFVKTMGLRHKPTMDWGMRARARNQVHWDKYWYQLETGKLKPAFGDWGEDRASLLSDPPGLAFSSSMQGVDGASKGGFDSLRRSEGPSDSSDGVSSTDEQSEPQSADMNTSFSQDSSSAKAPSDDDPGYYYFQQVLDHFPTLMAKPSETESQTTEFTPTSEPKNPGSASSGSKNTFRQYYHVSAEFYKPGGPVILWLPGETPLHSLFLQRGLAYEMANATSGLLIALEHRFYGKSIPRFQDTSPSNMESGNSTKQKRDMQDGSGRTGRGWGSWGATAVTHSSSKLDADSGPKSRGSGVIIGMGGGVVTSGSNKNKHHDPKHIGNTGYDSSAKEGLPLDLLEYLTVDQAIEDIVSFIDLFPTLQPLLFGPRPNTSSFSGTSTNSTFDNGSDTITRWILAGCSYGGNLAAWTRQRYPSKVFAAFASSAPVRSALDFFEYSTSQPDVLGPQCSQDLAAARDFLDGALQTTDAFMDQMSKLSYGDDLNATSSSLTEKRDQIDAKTTQQPMEELSVDKQKRYNAKLGVLSWFSPDFAHEYAVDGEEVHAAGWIWWTVASAVQYNAVVTPPTTLPAKTAVDVLCETMAEQHVLRDKSPDSLQAQAKYPPGAGISEAKALASWFKDQQYFTPTKTADLQPSDIDPNSLQNLASMAWLWQTCSELGYLQTSQPSACCCSQQSSDSHTAKKETGSSDIHTENEECSTIAMDQQEIVSLAFKGICSLRDWIFRSFREPSLVMEASPATLMSAPSANSCPMMTTPTASCLPCRCYSEGAQQKDSVFSRLLTLEAAWQECQFYFANTRNQNQGVDKLHTMKKKLPLLENYPDVERNVNSKFRGWEIGEDDEDEPVLETQSDHEQGMSQDQKTTDGNGSYSLVEGDIRDAQDDVVATVTEAVGVDAGTSLPSPQPRSVLASESEFHSGGRYYFTNGENDPWKDLTLASSNAQAFLSQRNALHQAGQKQQRAGDPDTFIPPTSITTTAITAATATSASADSFTPIPLQFPDKAGIAGALLSPHLELHSHACRDHNYHHHHRHGENYREHKRHRQNNRRRHRRPYRPIRGSGPGSTFTSASQDPRSTPDFPGSSIAVGVGGDDDEDDEAVESTLPLPDLAILVGVEESLTIGLGASPSSDSTPPAPAKVVSENLSAPQTSPTLKVPLETRFTIEEEDEVGDKNVMRIIPGASHCQDILYESTDLDSIELREERQHVLKTFVRWIAIDVKRQEQRRQRQTATSASGAGVD